MNSNNPAIGGLILVPIVIAASAAFIAIKASSITERAKRYCVNLWREKAPWSDKNKTQRRRRLRRSNLTSSQVYADSWCDLESVNSCDDFSKFIGQHRTQKSSSSDREKQALEASSEGWHPSRSARLLWSFSSPRSRMSNPYELSSVAKPSRAAHRPKRLSAEDADFLARPSRVKEVRRANTTDL